MAKIPSMKLVAVEWEDSRVPLARWTRLSDVPKAEASRIISVGFVWDDQPDCILLVSNVGDGRDDDAQAVGGMLIAKRQIVKIELLEEGCVIFSSRWRDAVPALSPKR